mgnify:CR=1 FL=1
MANSPTPLTPTKYQYGYFLDNIRFFITSYDTISLKLQIYISASGWCIFRVEVNVRQTTIDIIDASNSSHYT